MQKVTLWMLIPCIHTTFYICDMFKPLFLQYFTCLYTSHSALADHKDVFVFRKLMSLTRQDRQRNIFEPFNMPCAELIRCSYIYKLFVFIFQL
ncbi:hypothetical protein B938_02490 [Bacillus velezensis AS43.3]|nr:hypothetical protein B938_02490 [Bacillus velezensis AS43.3]ODB67367.1 hypothetical protein A7313_09030 [Bacillus velezensis]